MRAFLILPLCVVLATGEPPVPNGGGSYGAPQPASFGGLGGGQSQYGVPAEPQQPVFNQGGQPPEAQYGSPAVGPQPAFNQPSQPESQQYGAPVPAALGRGGPVSFGQPSAGPQLGFGQQPQQPQRTSQPGPITREPQQFYGQPGQQQGGQEEQYNQPPSEEGGKIHKHIYVHVAPDEPQEPKQQRERRPLPQPEKHYKILFIKAPSPSAGGDEEIQLPPAPEQKTLVYVLLQKPEFGPGGLSIAAPKPTKPSKPEVYFIRYKGGQKPGNQYGAPESPPGPKPSLPQPQQGFGGRAPNIGARQPQQPNFGRQSPPSQQYGQPQQPSFGGPSAQNLPQQPQFNQPQPNFGGPAPPQQQYGQPVPNFGSPQQAPQPQYGQPAPQQQQFSQPQPSYGPPGKK